MPLLAKDFLEYPLISTNAFTGPSNSLYMQLPTASNLVAAAASISQNKVGAGLKFAIQNTNATYSVSLTGSAGITIAPVTLSTSVASNTSSRFLLEFTNVTTGLEAVSLRAF
jgi:hypothetical protein